MKEEKSFTKTSINWYIPTNAKSLINLYKYSIFCLFLFTFLDKIYKRIQKGVITTYRSTSKKFLLVQNEGSRKVKRNVQYYNLDMVISIGYKVNTDRTIQFRRWATNVLKTFTIQRYVLDKERMKNGNCLLPNYLGDMLYY